MRRCPKGHDTVEVLADRFRCLECGTYFKEHDGSVDRGGLNFTGEYPLSAPTVETAKRTAAHAKGKK